MISREQKAIYRNDLFRHLDGIVTAPSAYALWKHGITDYIMMQEEVTLDQLTKQFEVNDGYLNVALRVLCSQGWLAYSIDAQQNLVSYKINQNSKYAFSLFPLYEGVTNLMKLSEKYHPRKFEKEPFILLEKIFSDYRESYKLSVPEHDFQKNIQHQILKHIEGMILGPSLVHLGMNGMFHKYFIQTRFKAEEFHADSKSFERLLDILEYFELFEKKNNAFQFTEKGLFFAKRASAYGVTVSYIPTLRKLDDLIFGNSLAAKLSSNNNAEGHVDRAMNVWGSGGAHASYFKVVDEIIIDLFNKPISEQPKGILDMGCGNGAFLNHLFDVIENQTSRGAMLDEYPLILVGADFNEAALNITKKNLIQADIWAKVIWGDIGKPALIADALKQSYNIELNDLLNVRSFLDHNRIWEKPDQLDAERLSTSTGAYAYEGSRLNNNAVEQSLVNHFNKWAPYFKKYGLLVIELHTVDPNIVSKNIGRSASTAYDGTHGYSDQFILELEVFRKAIQEIGMEADPKHTRKFPNSDLATISVHHFKHK